MQGLRRRIVSSFIVLCSISQVIGDDCSLATSCLSCTQEAAALATAEDDLIAAEDTLAYAETEADLDPSPENEAAVQLAEVWVVAAYDALQEAQDAYDDCVNQGTSPTVLIDTVSILE